MAYIEVPPAPVPAEWNRSSFPFSPGALPEPYQARIRSGYPDTGSIATLPPDKFAQFAEIVSAAAKRWPLQEVGTGKLKFHQKPDGAKVTYCGTIRPDADGNVAACKTKPYEHQIKGLPNSCKRRACPECWPDWSKKGAQRASSKLNGRVREILPQTVQDRLCKVLEASQGMEDRLVKEAIDQMMDDVDRYLPRHIVFSPDMKEIARLVRRTERAMVRQGIDITRDTWKYRDIFHKIFHKKYRRKLDQVIRIAGLTGGMEISHDIRLKKDKEARKADRDQDINRYREILDQPGWRYNVKFSPHSHTAAWGFLMNADTFHKLTGWVYVNYGTVYNAGGLTRYLLSHAPDNPGLHTVRYFGDLNPAYMVVEGEIRIPEFPPCEECLAAGVPRKDAEMVIAKLASVEYVKGEDRKTRISSWEFLDDGLSQKPYRTTKIIQVFRRKPPDPGRACRSPPRDPIPSWLTEEQRAERRRLEILQKKERDRIRRANQWIRRAAWDQLDQDGRDRHKWRQYYSIEEYAAATAAEKVLTWEWI